MTTEDPRPATPRLLLDEMHAPVVAQRLRDSGYDVVSIAEEPSLRALTDNDVFRWAAAEDRRIVTENIKDFRRLLVQADESGVPSAALLFTSNRHFPRMRRNPGPLIAALESWLTAPDAAKRPAEDWLHPGSQQRTSME